VLASAALVQLASRASAVNNARDLSAMSQKECEPWPAMPGLVCVCV
jgi:hypothetical protein